MKQIFTSALLFFSASLFAQQAIVPTKLAPTAPVEKCYSGILHQKLMAENPAYALRMNQFNDEVLSLSGNTGFLPKSPATYVVPVVFHIIHKGEAIGVGSNVSDDVIKKALKALNENYRNMNPQGGTDAQIEFALAVRDPNGNCTTGITRTNYSSNATYNSKGVQVQTANGITDATLKGIIGWNRQKYYNIYIVSEFDDNNGGSGIQGYAYTASMHGQPTDGAAFMASCVSEEGNKTLTHELGHAFNLLHTFQGDDPGNTGAATTCPPNSSPTTQGDMCADTPPHKRSQSDCNVSGTNACNGGTSNALFVHNYMDYSSDACMNQFTPNQSTRMQTACSGTRGSFFTSNQALVGPTAPVADFTVTQQIVCSGAVTLLDNSSCVPNTYTGLTGFSGYSFNWSVTNGSSTKTSTAQNPTITLSSAGWYNVTYTVTGPNGTDTKTVNNAFYYSGTNVTTCTPTFSNVGNYGINISQVGLNTINSTSSSSNTGTYDNNICTKNTVLNVGTSYPISVTINSYGYTSYMKAYIDWNNNGTYEASEIVLSGNVVASGSQVSKVVTGTVTIPGTAVKNAILRMRVIIDAQAAPTEAKANCSGSVTAGDVEDYGVMVKDNCPTATISTQPANQSVCPSGNTTFTTTTTGGTSYQWQVSTNGGSTWTNVTNTAPYSGATTQTLTLTGVTATYNNYKYKLVVTNSCGDVTTSVVTLTVTSAVSISTQPTNTSACKSDTKTFKVVATNATTYQWQVSTNGGGAWANLTNTAPYSGVSTATLTITNAPLNISTYQYRCVVSNTCGSPLNSNAGTLTVNDKPTATLGSFASVCKDDAAFTLTGGSPAGGTYSGNGVSGNTFDPAASGVGSMTITYTVTQNGCSGTATSTLVVDGCLGMEDVVKNELSIYPNPTNSIVYLKGNVEKYSTATLIDVQGRLIATWDLNKTTQFDVSNFRNGTYFLKIVGAENSVVTKIEIVK
jgi:hypothetical protein